MRLMLYSKGKELCNEKLDEIIQILKAKTHIITSCEKEKDIKISIDILRSDISQKINVIQAEILKVKIRFEQVLTNTNLLQPVQRNKSSERIQIEMVSTETQSVKLIMYKLHQWKHKH